MNLSVKRLAVGQMSSNCYLVHNKKNLVIIDPGDDAEYIKDSISDIEAKPVAILATHGHFDHILAANELQLVYRIPFIISQEDKFLVSRMAETAKYFIGEINSLTPKISKYFDKSIIYEGKKWFDVINTPGHTPGSVSFYRKRNNILFSGDLIFEAGGVGRTDYQYANNDKLINSIEKALRLPDETVVYSGHGKEFTIADFKKSYYNQG